MKNLQDAGVDNVLFWINEYDLFRGATVPQQRQSDVMTSFLLSARSAVYYEAGSPLVGGRID
jgi:hypothetical protein